MKFKINGMNWKIIEKSQKEIKTRMNKRRANEDENINTVDTRYYGVTFHDDLEIVLDKDLPKDRKKKVLIHELAHCYIGSYITHEDKTYDEEMVADIICNSHEIINEIVKNYFKK